MHSMSLLDCSSRLVEHAHRFSRMRHWTSQARLATHDPADQWESQGVVWRPAWAPTGWHQKQPPWVAFHSFSLLCPGGSGPGFHCQTGHSTTVRSLSYLLSTSFGRRKPSAAPLFSLQLHSTTHKPARNRIRKATSTRVVRACNVACRARRDTPEPRHPDSPEQDKLDLIHTSRGPGGARTRASV